jgi:hypothetical protein
VERGGLGFREEQLSFAVVMLIQYEKIMIYL